MLPQPKLLDFFRREFESEERSGFARLLRIPDSHVAAKLMHYKSLSRPDQEAFIDCCAHWAHANYGFVIGAPKIEHTKHPFFDSWLGGHRFFYGELRKSVPLLRAAVQTYKMDVKRGGMSAVSREEFEYASSIRPIKAPELRKRVRATLKSFGYRRMDEMKRYCCGQGEREFRVDVDFGGMSAQFRYVVIRPEFTDIHPLSQFRFERALGMGLGDWDYIVEENVDEVFRIFAEVVEYSFTLPDRIRAEC
jgi:hypothetical protein